MSETGEVHDHLTANELRPGLCLGGASLSSTHNKTEVGSAISSKPGAAAIMSGNRNRERVMMAPQVAQLGGVAHVEHALHGVGGVVDHPSAGAPGTRICLGRGLGRKKQVPSLRCGKNC